MRDLKVLWPTEEELEASDPSPPKVKILQQWQDADEVTLYKMKGDLTDRQLQRDISPGCCLEGSGVKAYTVFIDFARLLHH